MATKSIVQFNIKGNGARPDRIGMGDLGDLLKHLDAAIRAAVPPEIRIDNATSTDPVVSLVSVVEGQSSDMGIAVMDYGVPALRDITEAITTKTFSTLPGETQEEMSCVSRWAVRHKFSVEFEENPSLGIRHAVISRHNPFPSPASAAVVDGVTTAWGYLIRAGGKKPRAALLFPGGSSLRITCDERITKELGERLYEDVGIEGIATWRVSDWKMIAFKAIRVLDYRPESTNPVQSFKDLAAASGGRWDDVDAAEYVQNLRGEAAE